MSIDEAKKEIRSTLSGLSDQKTSKVLTKAFNIIFDCIEKDDVEILESEEEV